LPAGSFLFDKRIHPEGLYRFKIFDHAHPIFGLIAFVDVFDARAWEFGTIHAQSGRDVFEILTIFDPASGTMSG
jgi:hypothetical protein